MKLVANISSLNTPALFASASRRIILHAAVYGAFMRSQAHCSGLESALRNPAFRRLDIIALDPDADCGWDDAFLDALRFGISRRSARDEVHASFGFLKNLARKHPDTVHLHRIRRLPCLPIVVCDDTIVFGQYAHACNHAPSGFWGMVHADVETLLLWAAQGRPPHWASDTDIASFRLISECVRAMQTPFAVALPAHHGPIYLPTPTDNPAPETVLN